MMKKNAVKILTVVLCLATCFSLAACGSVSTEDATVEGTTWIVTSVTDAEGTVVTGEDIVALTGEITYEFKADGVFVASVDGLSVEGTWSQDGNTVTFANDSSSFEGIIDGDQLTVDANGAVTVFTKQ